MKKFLYSFLLLSSATLFAQKNTATKFAVANDIVGTVDMFTNYKKVIQGSQVYKTQAALPQNLKKFSSLAENNGLTEFKFNTKQYNIDSVGLFEMNVQHELPKENPVFIDGYELTDANIYIFGDLLAKMEVKNKDGKKYLYISTKK